MSLLCQITTFLLIVSAANAAPKLEAINGDATGVSVSGISAGGAMAMQYHVAYSSSTMGAGLVAGVAYHCAQGSLSTALGACMKTPQLVSASSLTSYAQEAARAGKIDSLDNLKNDNVYVFGGTLDNTVAPGEGKIAEQMYQSWGANVKGVFDKAAVHTMPTDNYGAACNRQGSPYINNCNYNAAYELLNHIYGDLLAPTAAPAQNLRQFDQAEFTSSTSLKRRFLTGTLTSTWTDLLNKNINTITDFWKKWLPGGGALPGLGGTLPGLGGSLPGLGGGVLPGLGSSSGALMDSVGYVYVPTACQNKEKSCRVHVAFHGCLQGREKIGDVYAKNAGYNEVAEANNIVILYPQAASNMIKNPNGCFDWWGYTDQNYALKSGVQMKAIKAMVDRITV